MNSNFKEYENTFQYLRMLENELEELQEERYDEYADTEDIDIQISTVKHDIAKTKERLEALK